MMNNIGLVKVFIAQVWLIHIKVSVEYTCPVHGRSKGLKGHALVPFHTTRTVKNISFKVLRKATIYPKCWNCRKPFISKVPYRTPPGAYNINKSYILNFTFLPLQHSPIPLAGEEGLAVPAKNSLLWICCGVSSIAE